MKTFSTKIGLSIFPAIGCCFSTSCPSSAQRSRSDAPTAGRRQHHGFTGNGLDELSGEFHVGRGDESLRLWLPHRSAEGMHLHAAADPTLPFESVRARCSIESISRLKCRVCAIKSWPAKTPVSPPISFACESTRLDPFSCSDSRKQKFTPTRKWAPGKSNASAQ